MRLAIFNKKNPIEIIYDQVDAVLRDNGYISETGLVPEARKKEAVLASLRKMNRGNHFSICDVRNMFKLHNIHPPSEVMDYLETFHCVDWGDMGEDTRAFINALILKELQPGMYESVT